MGKLVLYHGSPNIVENPAYGKGKRYNDVVIYTLPYGVMAALNGNLLLASSSSHVLESSVRHLENNILRS